MWDLQLYELFAFCNSALKEVSIFLILGEKNVGINYGTFSVYVFSKFDEKIIQFGWKLSENFFLLHYIYFTKIAATVPLCIGTRCIVDCIEHSTFIPSYAPSVMQPMCITLQFITNINYSFVHYLWASCTLQNILRWFWR